MPRVALYLAAPLFSDAERAFNTLLKRRLSDYFAVYLPQEDGDLVTDLVVRGGTYEEAYRKVFANDLAAIRCSQVMVAVLDGRGVDEGVAFELGLAYSMGKVCVGLQTDFRRLIEGRNNPMIDCAINLHFCNTVELYRWAREYCAKEDQVDAVV